MDQSDIDHVARVPLQRIPPWEGMPAVIHSGPMQIADQPVGVFISHRRAKLYAYYLAQAVSAVDRVGAPDTRRCRQVVNQLRAFLLSAHRRA